MRREAVAVNVPNLLICPDCGAGVEYDDTTFAASCPECGTRIQPRTGAC